MRNALLLAFAIVLGTAAGSSALAADEQEFKAALAAAESANREAGALKNQWTTTAQSLNAAKRAAAAGDYDRAVSLARQAEALAKASIEQSKREDQAWRNAVIR